MAIEKGTESNEDKKTDNAPDVAAFKIQIELMQRELAEMRKNNVPQQSFAPGGMSGDQFAELIKAVKASEKPEQHRLSVKTFVEAKDIDPDDFDSKGVLFCAPSTGYLIVDDFRQGFAVNTPYNNEIFFMFNGQKISRDGDGHQVLNTFCSYESKSFKEQEWLRAHRYFGLKFFESAKEALSADSAKAQRIAKYVDMLVSDDSASLFTKCKSYGVPVSDDVRTMRILLANKMADKAEGEQESITKNILKDKMEQELFLNDPKQFTPERKNRSI